MFLTLSVVPVSLLTVLGSRGHHALMAPPVVFLHAEMFISIAYSAIVVLKTACEQSYGPW